MIEYLKTATWMLLGLVLVAGCQQTPSEPEPEPRPGPVELTDEESITAEVLAVDVPGRSVTLRAPDGQEGTLTVPEARNLDQVEPGDTLTVAYAITYRAYLAEPGQTESGSAVAAGVAPVGERPGAFIGALTATSLEILSVAEDGSRVSFRDEVGVLDSMDVVTAEGREFARELKQGDVVVLEFMESVTIDVAEQDAADQ